MTPSPTKKKAPTGRTKKAEAGPAQQPHDVDAHILQQLAGDLASKAPDERMHAALVLGRFGTSPMAMEALKRLISHDADDEVRYQSRMAYGRLKARIGEGLARNMGVLHERTPTLNLQRFKEYLVHENPIYRIEAVLQALRARSGEILSLIRERLSDEKDEWVVATLIRALGMLGKKSDVAMLRQYLGWEGHPRVVANSVEAIAELDPSVVFALISPLLDSRETRVQAAAVRALHHVDRDAALEGLRAMAQSPWPSLRASAAHCLVELADPDAEHILVDLLAELGTSRTLKISLANHLAEKGSTEAFKKVKHLVDKATDEEREVVYAKVFKRTH